jgi:hypothetical protein
MSIFSIVRAAADQAASQAKNLLQQALQPPIQKQLPAPRENRALWDPNTRLLDLTGHDDWLTLGDMYTGIGVFGAAGSGKTSSLVLIAYTLMELQAGFCWCCVKPDEVDLACKLARAAGREQDVIVIGQDMDGTISPHCFNALAYEASIPATGTSSIADYLCACAKLLSRKEGERSGASGEQFWEDQFNRLVRHCIDTAKLAGRPLSVGLLREIQISAPASSAQLSDEGWGERSTCWQCLNEAEARLDAGEIVEADFNRILTFWTKDYCSLDIKPRSTIDVMFAVLVDAFYAEEPLRTILTTDTTVTPEDVIERGKIVILSLPTNIYHSAGAMAQFCFKYSFQRRMLARRKNADGSPLRPAVMWLDEAHALAHSKDAQYFAEVRSNRGINVYLEQGVGGYMRALGLQHAEEVDGFLQNLATKLFFQNNSPATNRFAADAIGKLLQSKGTENWGGSQSGGHFGGSETIEERHQITVGDFGLLKRGGPENDRIVEGYVLKPGIFNATGTNVALCRFPQTDLTK